ncbi:DEAD-box ATP-dependent RNA helicase [Ceratobasidium sp. UAMH 11750]|nr:DEAD-box ATP-dependent RNA helicase [Ceratobasidium sp. UAMH 11750]
MRAAGSPRVDRRRRPAPARTWLLEDSAWPNFTGFFLRLREVCWTGARNRGVGACPYARFLSTPIASTSIKVAIEVDQRFPLPLSSLPARTPQAGNQSNGWSDSSNAPPHRPDSFGRTMRSSSGSSWAPRGSSSGEFGSTGRSAISSWATPPSQNSGRCSDGYGYWKDGKHITAPRNPTMERELYGDAEDPLKQHTGINFDKYEDIPVEATGAGVPEPVNQFTNSPLDPVLLDNIQYTRYTTPTPVQKYSIPIVAAGRDLMACAQTGSGKTGGFLFPILSASFAAGPRPPPADPNASYGRRRAYPTALILAPTRELVSQIHDEARKLAYRS